MAKDRLAILHVLAPADVGGLETVVRSLALGHSAMGHSVEIAAVLNTPASPFVQEARDSGIVVHIVESPARSLIPERRAVQTLLASKHFDVLHSHGYRSDILNLGIARRMRVPSVTTLHGFSATDSRARAYEWLQLRGARKASAIVAVSTNVADKVRASGARSESVHLIRNAVGSTSPLASSEDARARLHLGGEFNIGWVGRLSAEKGPDVMVDAMSYLSDLPVALSFVGDGPDRSRLGERARRLGIGELVLFHGNVPRAGELLRAFDLLALSSRTEGTPMILLEAMAAEVPIVATRVGGVPDMLSPAEALLADPEDPKALSLAIRAALLNPEASRERAVRAHSRLISDFSSDAWLVRYEELYRSIQPTSPEHRE